MYRDIGFVFLLLLGFSAQANWPTQQWLTKSTEQAVANKQALASLERFAFPKNIDEQKRDGIRTNGLIIIKDGLLVYERYGRGFNRETPHLSWSMSKSVINALYGRAVMQQKISIEDKIIEKSPWVKGLDELTYRQVLEMSSGIRWSESYEFAPLYSSVAAMLYTRGHANMPQFVAQQGVEFQPGTHWEYSSGDTNLLSGALKDIVGEDEYPNYPWTALFDVIGANSSVWEMDQNNHFVGSSYWYATPRDMAKFAYLFLKDGIWDQQRLLPEGWVDYSCSINAAYKETFKNGQHMGEQAYGAQFWVNAEDPEYGIKSTWPDVPKDACAALGHWRQLMAFIPSENMVVVRVADDRTGDGAITNNTILKYAVEAFATNSINKGAR